MRWEERLAKFIGDIHRPVSLTALTLSGAYASCVVAHKVSDGNDGAIFLAAVLAGTGTLYGFRSVENWRNRRTEADVAIAKVEKSSDQQNRQ